MKKQLILEGKLGKFHYSPAVAVGNVCYCGGHFGIDSEGRLANGLEAETRLMLENLKRTLAAAGMSLENVVRTSLWLRSFDDLSAIDRIYAEYFPEAPARTTFEIGKLPADASMEIDAIAVRE